MKTLVMPVRPQPSTTRGIRAKRHFRIVLNEARYAATVTLTLLVGLAATIVLASAFALALGVIFGLAAAAVIALVFLVINPEGNLLLLLLLSQLWLLYAPRERASNPQPDGGLTMEPQESGAFQPQHALAA